MTSKAENTQSIQDQASIELNARRSIEQVEEGNELTPKFDDEGLIWRRNSSDGAWRSMYSISATWPASSTWFSRSARRSTPARPLAGWSMNCRPTSNRSAKRAVNCRAGLASLPDARQRILSGPDRDIQGSSDLIIGSWCGRKFRPERVSMLTGF